MAFLATMMNNLTLSVHGKKGAKQSGIEEFMPNWDITAPKAEKVQSVEDMRKVFEDIVASQKKKPGIQPKPPRFKEEKNG